MHVVALGISFGAVLIAAAFAAPPAGDKVLGVDLPDGEDVTTAADTVLPQLAEDTRLPQRAEETSHGATQVRAVRVPGARYLVAPGQSSRSGPGKLQTFRVEVESGIKGISPSQFAAEVEDRLLDHRSWGHLDGRSLQRVSTGKSDFRVSLTRSKTVDRMCYPLATNAFVSCYMDGRAIINLQRWRKGAPDFSSLRKYRTYLINHEVGHALGREHWFCPPRGGRGRVMMQQTYQLWDNCSPQRFPRPNAPKFRSKCTVVVRSLAWRLHVEGQVSTTTRKLSIKIAAAGDEGTNVIGSVRTTSDGRFSVPIDPAALSPGTKSISLNFAGNRDLAACQQRTPVIPGA